MAHDCPAGFYEVDSSFNEIDGDGIGLQQNTWKKSPHRNNERSHSNSKTNDNSSYVQHPQMNRESCNLQT